MENGPFIDDFPIKTTIYSGFSIAMLNSQIVLRKGCREKRTSRRKTHQEMMQRTDVIARARYRSFRINWAFPSAGVPGYPFVKVPSPGLPGPYWYNSTIFIYIALVMSIFMKRLVFYSMCCCVSAPCNYNQVCSNLRCPLRCPLLQVLWLIWCSSCLFGL